MSGNLSLSQQVKLLRNAIKADIEVGRKAMLVGDANGADELKVMVAGADKAWAEFEEFSNKHMRVGKGWDLQVILDKMKEELKNESGSNQSERPKDKAGH